MKREEGSILSRIGITLLRGRLLGRNAGWENTMGDVTMVLMILAFFFGCIGYVTWCGRIIGPDPEEMDADLDSENDATAVRA